MTLHAIEPAPVVDLVELIEGDLTRVIPFRLRCILWQVAHSDSVGFVNDAAELVAAIGFTPLPSERSGEQLQELWFACRPDVTPYLVALCHLARLTVSRLGHSGVVRIRAHVRAGHRPGQRLARLMGFSFVGDPADKLERWEWTNG